jgi:murein DD-endopeptidase MepM/ murein hydrolase activator NlpD
MPRVLRLTVALLLAVAVLVTFHYGPWWSHVAAIAACAAAPVVAPLLARDDATWRDVPAVVGFLVRSQVLAALNPYVVAQSLRQTAGQLAAAVRYRGRLPAPDTYDAPVRLHLPVTGTWTVVNGGTTPATSHSWALPHQRYAYDLVVQRDGASHAGDGTDLADYHAYDRPVVAPADGTVVEVIDGVRDYPHPKPRAGRLDWRTRDIRGNTVVIRHAEGVFCVLAHLRPGSIGVAEGERVARGQEVGRCGNAGFSTEPHLHVHVQDRADFYTAAGLPVPFAACALDGVPHEAAFPERGQTVAPLADAADAAAADDEAPGDEARLAPSVEAG